MATSLDLALIDDYTAGMNVPLASQAGYGCQADSDGTNVEYVGPQEITGSGAWNKRSRTILVRGNGARSITLGTPLHVGYEVRVVDADASAGAGTITAVGGDTMSVVGTTTVTTNLGSALFIATAAATWSRIT